MEFANEKKAFFVPFILSKGNFLRFVFYLSVQCIEYTFRICILLHFKKYYFIHFCCLFLKKTKAFSVSLSHFNLIWSFFCQSVELYPFFSQIWSFSIVFCFIMHNRFILIKFVDLDDSWAKIGTILILLNKQELKIGKGWVTYLFSYAIRNNDVLGVG